MNALQQAQFANQTGRFYQTLAQQIGDLLHQKIGELSPQETSVLSNDQIRLISYSNTFFSISDSISFAGSESYYDEVSQLTGDIASAINHIDKVTDIITLCAATLSLAAGIVSENSALLLASMTEIKKSISGLVDLKTDPSEE